MKRRHSESFVVTNKRRIPLTFSKLIHPECYSGGIILCSNDNNQIYQILADYNDDNGTEYGLEELEEKTGIHAETLDVTCTENSDGDSEVVGIE